MQTQTVNISMPKPLLARVDRYVKKSSLTRSELIRQLLRNYVDKKKSWADIFNLGDRINQKLKLTENDIQQAVNGYRTAQK